MPLNSLTGDAKLNTINFTGPYLENDRDVIALDNCNYLVVWSTPNNLRARLFSPDGDPLTADLALASPTLPPAPTDRYHALPDAVALPGGGFAIAWHTAKNPATTGGTQSGDLRLQYFDAAGVATSPVPVVDDSAVQSFTFNHIQATRLSTGNIAVTCVNTGSAKTATFQSRIYDTAGGGADRRANRRLEPAAHLRFLLHR
jgi:hypothetical protein